MGHSHHDAGSGIQQSHSGRNVVVVDVLIAHLLCVGVSVGLALVHVVVLGIDAEGNGVLSCPSGGWWRCWFERHNDLFLDSEDWKEHCAECPQEPLGGMRGAEKHVQFT